MNFLLKGRHFLMGSEFIKRQNRIKFTENNFQLISRQLDVNQSLVRREYSQITTVIILSQLSPFFAVLFARFARRRWPQITYTNKRVVFEWISRNRLKVVSAVSLMSGALFVGLKTFSEETPLTKRRRFVIFEQKDYMPLSDIMSKIIFKSNKERILPHDHKHTEKVQKIVRKLLESNKEYKELADKNWSVYVIKASDTINAFVLPNGHIYVYTGIMSICDNEDQLAVILAHELSHTLLAHGKETLSQEVCIDFLYSMGVFLLWSRFRPFRAMLSCFGTGLALNALLIAPKRKSIELEADYVGLELAAKACYDIREGSALWMKMSTIDRRRVPNALSTHPTNISRSQKMDTYMESMIKIRECSDCPELSESDPRLKMKRFLLSQNLNSEKDSNDYRVFK